MPGPLNGCPICGSPGPRPSFRSSRGPVWHCRKCGVFFVVDAIAQPDQAALFYETIDEVLYVDYFEPFRKGQYRQVVGGLNLPSGALHLDVGASYGWMVEVGLELGLDSSGIEPGEAVPTAERARHRIRRASLEDFAASAGRRFDLITLWHVLEHLPEPQRALQLLRGLLADGGRLLIAVPNALGHFYRVGLLLQQTLHRPELMNELWYFHNPNMHFYYYTPRALAELVRGSQLALHEQATIEAFDWRTIYGRIRSPLPRLLLRAMGPVLARSRFTGRENLITIAGR
jgi:2-polyprenyl-3-methyl-5-hydroxy-6-metoxy-1,4-benzoquinol methylase